MLDFSARQQNQISLLKKLSILIAGLTWHHAAVGDFHRLHGGDEQFIKLGAVAVGRADVCRPGIGVGNTRPDFGRKGIDSRQEKQPAVRQKIYRRDQDTPRLRYSTLLLFALLSRRFLLDRDLQMRGHILMQLDRNGELTDGLQRLVQLDLAAVKVEALFLQRLGDVA